jgi:hypothetical protein
MTTATVVSGDDIDLLIALKANAAAFNMGGATVTARIVTADRQTALTAEIVQDSGATGADYANSLVAIEMTAAETASIDYQGSGYIEIQVALPAKKTWFLPVQVIKGNIA